MVLSQFPGSQRQHRGQYSESKMPRAPSLPTYVSSLLLALSVLPEVSLELAFAQFFSEATNSQETI